MTTIHIHGQLSESFPEVSLIALRKVSDVMLAMDAVYEGFRVTLLKLANMGIHYGVVSDGQDIRSLEEAQLNKEPEEIHLIPMICGAGVAAAAGLIAAGAGLMAGAGTVGTLLGISTTLVGQVGLLIAGIGVQMLLAPKPDMPRPESRVSGGSESSFLSSNTANLMTQGSPLPIGYGRLRVGSAVINATAKSFQVGKKQRATMLSNTSGKVGDVNTNISTKQGNKSR